jgi:hypothetical protein
MRQPGGVSARPADPARSRHGPRAAAGSAAPRNRLSRTCALITASLITASLLVVGLLAGSSAGADRRPIGAVPDSKLDTIINTDQLELVTRTEDAAVSTATAHLSQAEERVTSDGRTLARDRADATDAGALRAKAVADVDRDVGQVRMASAAHGRAVGDEGLERRRLQDLAIGWYTGGATVDPSDATSLRVSQQVDDVDTELQLITSITSLALRRDTALAASTGARLASEVTTLGRARTTLVAALAEVDDAAGVLAAATRHLDRDHTTVATDAAALTAGRTARARTVSAFDGPEGGGTHPVPSILGRSALTRAQIVAWFRSDGRVVGTRTDIRQLATWYISEGKAEGVRGDIAFAQAVVETGGFDSPDAIHRNNYAGIGHCDSCGGGLRLPSPLGGVRTQIQLLRTFADPTLTTADLPSPPPVAALAPEDQTRRGCCRTWNSLTGVWATDPLYGRTVLEVYDEMLAYTVAEQAATRRDAPSGG